MILKSALNLPKAQVNLIGAPSFAQVNPYGIYNTYCADEYSSQFPNIRPIVNELMKIPAHAVDSKGRQIDHPALDALYHPNRTDSYTLFLEKLGVSVLSLDYTYLLVWRKTANKAVPYGEFATGGKNIGGYTFLENPGIEYRDGVIYYKMGSQEFTENEVIAIPGGAKPGNLYGGYSPAHSSAKWATLDGYIGDYQKGFFENNAIPAGMFQIVAATDTDFKDMKEKLQEKHRGAGNNNNVAYSHVPVDETGKPTQAQITWIPFSQSNKEIDFKNLLDHVDNRLSESYGVSSIIKGIDSNAKYSNAEVSKAIFAEGAVDPLALRIFSQITHELNRITGGLGVAITYKYDIPAVSDAEKVKAETSKIKDERVQSWLDKGYTLSSIKEYMKTGDIEDLEKDIVESIEDQEEVDEGNEVKDAPDRTEIDGVTPIGEAKHINPKSELTNEDKLEKVAKDYLKSQVERAILEYLDDPETPVDKVKMQVNPEPTEEELNAFVAAAYTIVLSILIASGKEEYAAGVAAAGLSIGDLQGFMLPDMAEDYYQAYLRRVGTTYGSETSEHIQKVLLDARDNGLTRRETEKALRDIIGLDDYRVKKLARTELNHSQNMGKLEGMKSLAAETDTQWEKTIDHSGTAPCPLCASQEGIWKSIDTPLWAEGTTIETEDDNGDTVVYVNNWQSNEAQDYHPNGTGVLVFRRVDT